MESILLIHLAIAIALALFIIIRLKQSAFLALFISTLYYGLAAGMDLSAIVRAIGDGFGGTMRGIGLVIGFGVLIGQLLADCGGVTSIVNGFLRVVSKRRIPEALTATGLVVSTPVFFDVGFVILAPIARRLARLTESPLAITLGALVIGLGTAHMLIPPTPGPLAVADALKVPLALMIVGGALVGIPGAFLALLVYRLALKYLRWAPEMDEEPITIEREVEVKMPPFRLAIIPIALPILLICLASIVPIVLGKEVGMAGKILLFLGARDIAMFLGAMAAMGVATTTMDRMAIAKSVGDAISSAGIILLITAVGGSFGSVLGASGIGKIFGAALGAQVSPILAMLLAWCIAAGIKAAQGSGTVAMITTASLMAPIAPYIAINPLWLAIAIGSGGLLGCHVNDSGFWVVAKTGGLSVKGGLKVYTVSTAINAITTLIFILIFQAFLFR